jgi:hypothetical protein
MSAGAESHENQNCFAQGKDSSAPTAREVAIIESILIVNQESDVRLPGAFAPIRSRFRHSIVAL